LTKVTILGGVAEIGGNKILVEDRNTRLLLDFGMSLTSRSRYFSDPYLSPRSVNSLLELGIIPSVDGLYNWDSISKVDAVILSHAHLDHYGYLSLVNRKIPIFCGETTMKIMDAIKRTKRRSVESDFSGLRYSTFRTNSKVKMGDTRITPVHVDHSIPGAYGFILETDGGRIVYTGDFRAHGRKKELTADFISAAGSEKSEVLITEATNMVGGVVSSEEEINLKLENVIARSGGLVMATFSNMDTDRLMSFYNSAKAADRTLLLSAKQAYLLFMLGDDPKLGLPKLRDPGIAIYQKRKARPEKWEIEVGAEAQTVDSRELGKKQKGYVFAASLSDMESLVEIKPGPGSLYILSASEPFTEEMEIDMQRLIEWLDAYGMPQYHIHVSGHIMPQDLRDFVQTIDSQHVVPIHTEHPALFKKYMAQGEKVTLPTAGKSIVL
jgi:ribonuclease J